ncbi:MAG: hypothetical protein AAF628_14530 [Planctomycetota bacterium]
MPFRALLDHWNDLPEIADECWPELLQWLHRGGHLTDGEDPVSEDLAHLLRELAGLRGKPTWGPPEGASISDRAHDERRARAELVGCAQETCVAEIPGLAFGEPDAVVLDASSKVASFQVSVLASESLGLTVPIRVRLQTRPAQGFVVTKSLTAECREAVFDVRATTLGDNLLWWTVFLSPEERRFRPRQFHVHAR